MAATAQGQGVIISAIGPGNGDGSLLVKATDSLLSGLAGSKTRLIVVGGAGGLEVAPDKRLVDTPNFPQAWKSLALAHIEAYQHYPVNAAVDWAYAAPAALIEPGERTAKFRTGEDQLIVDEKSQSRISAEDFAVGY